MEGQLAACTTRQPPSSAHQVVVLVLVAASLFTLGSCDTFHGVRRDAPVHELPDLPRLKARIESYPERMRVELRHEQGGVLITITGIHDDDEVFSLLYGDGKNIHGVLQFTRTYKGKIRYSQYLIRLNHPPPQEWVDATWPVMKRIERDLAQEFGLPELGTAVETDVFGGVEDPDRLARGTP